MSQRTVGGRRRALLVVAIVLFAVPCAVLVVRAAFSGWATSSDYSSIELRTRAVTTTDIPLVGQYSRFGWNHPGPLLYYALALPYRLFGSESPGLLAGAVLVNAAALAYSLWVGWRRGRVVGLALCALCLAVFVHAFGGGTLADPWNPYIIVLPVFALAMAAWSAMCRDHWMLPVAIAFASFTTQSHVGSATASILLVTVAVAFFVRDVIKRQVVHALAVALVSLGVGLLLWLPALIDQFRPGGGNLGAILDFWRSPPESQPGYGDAARLLFPQLGIRPSFITGNEPVNAFTGALDPHRTFPVMLVLLLAASIIAFRRRDRQSFTLTVVAFTLIVASWVGIAGIVGEPFPYLVRWTWIAGAFVWLAIAWTAWRSLAAVFRPLDPRRRVAARLLEFVATGAVVVMLVATTIDASRTDPPDARQSDLTKQLASEITTALDGTDNPILVVPAGSFGSAVVTDGVLVRLVKAGVRAGRTPDQDWVVGSRYTVPADTPRDEVRIATEDEEIERYRRDLRWREIGQYDTLTAAERGELSTLQAELAYLSTQAKNRDELAVLLREHHDDYRRARALHERAFRAVAFQRG